MVNTSDFTEGSWIMVPSVDLPVEGSMSQEDVEAAVEACAQQMLQPDIAATQADFIRGNPTPPGQPTQYAPEQPAVETHSAQQTVVPKAKAKKAKSKTSGVHTVKNYVNVGSVYYTTSVGVGLGVWPYGWLQPTHGFVCMAINNAHVQKGTLDAIITYVGEKLRGDLYRASEEVISAYYEVEYTSSKLGRITIGVTSRPSTSRNVALACMGPRIYIRGIHRAMHDIDECQSFMYYLRENFGRVAS